MSYLHKHQPVTDCSTYNKPDAKKYLKIFQQEQKNMVVYFQEMYFQVYVGCFNQTYKANFAFEDLLVMNAKAYIL